MFSNKIWGGKCRDYYEDMFGKILNKWKGTHSASVVRDRLRRLYMLGSLVFFNSKLASDSSYEKALFLSWSYIMYLKLSLVSKQRIIELLRLGDHHFIVPQQLFFFSIRNTQFRYTEKKCFGTILKCRPPFKFFF